MRRIVGLLVIVAAVAACSPDQGRGPQPIVGWSVADSEVHLWVDTCNGEPEAEVVETSTDVTITVVSTRQNPGDGCQDNLTVELDAPLDGRTLVDGATGRTPEPMEG